MTYRILFVCTGNICRSPTAQGVFRQQLVEGGLLQTIQVDSAATHAYRLDEPPDAFALTVASQRGIDISGLRSRHINREDFFQADMIVAMDEANRAALHRQAPASQAHKIRLLLEFAGGGEVDDPYGQPLASFETAFDRIEQGVTALLEDLLSRLEKLDQGTSAGGR